MADPAVLRDEWIRATRDPAPRGHVAVEGRNCWRVLPASRAAFLVDADEYFRALVHTLLRARHQVLVLGWDLQATVRLQPRGMPSGLPADLRGFLNALVARRPTLRIHLLEWDFSLLFAFERELLPLIRLGWRTHRRIDFALDAQHPLGACHHQKIVVVDDAVAFVGGLDLTGRRWDTRRHRADDPDRGDGNGTPYAPFHDVQVAVQGEPAALLGQLARKRWRLATGHRLTPPPRRLGVWPPELPAHLHDAPVAIARTIPGRDGRPAVREVEALYIDSILAARRTIYIENQYLTSDRICAALAARLEERDGPEVILVLPRTCSGWLEENTMGALRHGFLERLRGADRFGRLRALYPRITADDAVCVNVHAKVMVIDDVLVRVGSSNLSNRSMGLDTECDIVIEACGRPDLARGIADFRNGLVAEHLGRRTEEVARALDHAGSLAGAIAALNTDGRSLCPIQSAARAPWLDDTLPASSFDRERPIEEADIVATAVRCELREPLLRMVIRLLMFAGILASASALWACTDLVSWHPERLVQWAAPLVRSPLAPVAVAGVFVIASGAMLPVTGLVIVALLLFDPLRGALYALGGTMAAAAVAHVVGRTMWNMRLRKVSRPHFERVTRQLAGRGVLAVALVRLVPIAPFTVVSLVAGRIGMSAWRFLLGTLVGVTPGIALGTAVVCALS